MSRTLGLPGSIRACLFDLDGVLTQTASLHAAAWKEMFDAYLRERSARLNVAFVPFDDLGDYHSYVDGKQRNDAVRSFLASRRIKLPEGAAGDPPDAETVAGLGRRKSELVLALIRDQGAATYEGSVEFVRAARAAGLRTAVVSASSNCEEVLRAAGIADLFDARVDAVVAEREGLRGKPAPDMFLAAARALDVLPHEAAIFEDALPGVAAGRAGRFGFVAAVDRIGQARSLRRQGAHAVVSDLAELLDA
jgi:beta-phosphoglucomutase family hydrolase